MSAHTNKPRRYTSVILWVIAALWCAAVLPVVTNAHAQIGGILAVAAYAVALPITAVLVYYAVRGLPLED